MCCKLMVVPNFSGKPDPQQWCVHADRKCGRCRIYEMRPQACRDFTCLWLIEHKIPDYWFPARSKIVISPKLGGPDAFISFVVDPAYPRRWREEPWFSDIKKIAKAGLAGLAGQKWTTVVLVGEDLRIPILP
jgi:hypothetical protein